MNARLFESQPKYGFCNSMGEIIVSPRFDEAKSNKYFNAFRVGNYWGFFNNDGKCIHEARFDRIEFLNDKVAVTENDVKILLNSKMDKVIEYEFKSIKKEGKFYIIQKMNNTYDLYSFDFKLRISNCISIKAFDKFFITVNDNNDIEIYERYKDGSVKKQKTILDAKIMGYSTYYFNENTLCRIIHIEQKEEHIIVVFDEESYRMQIIPVGEEELLVKKTFYRRSFLISRTSNGMFHLYYLVETLCGEKCIKQICEGINIKDYTEFGDLLILITDKNKYVQIDKNFNVISKKISLKDRRTIRNCY